MEEQNTTPVASAEPAPAKSDEPIILGGEKKTSKGMVAGLIILAVLAVAGIAFGIFEMMQAANKDGQIAHLNQQVTDCANAGNGSVEKIEVTCPDGTVIEDEVPSYKNPIIKGNNTSEAYDVIFESGSIQGSGVDTVQIIYANGAVESCVLMDKEYYENGGYRGTKINDCNIVGLSGDIYKIIEFGEGQMNNKASIGFIMTDGTIKYIPLYDAVNNNDFSIKGNVNIDGYVVDAINVGVKDLDRGYGGYQSTIFVLADGSTVKYSESML